MLLHRSIKLKALIKQSFKWRVNVKEAKQQQKKPTYGKQPFPTIRVEKKFLVQSNQTLQYFSTNLYAFWLNKLDVNKDRLHYIHMPSKAMNNSTQGKRKQTKLHKFTFMLIWINSTCHCVLKSTQYLRFVYIYTINLDWYIF